MKTLFAPWRSDYSNNPTHPSRQPHAAEGECVFCTIYKENNDEKNLILKRFEHTFIMLNKYPYNAGHVLILPIAHKNFLADFTKETRIELMELASISSDLLKKNLDADGINIGINLGKGAGAGIPSHLHMHVVPRWLGDTNFMPILADTKVVSVDLETMYKELLAVFDGIEL